MSFYKKIWNEEEIPYLITEITNALVGDLNNEIRSKMKSSILKLDGDINVRNLNGMTLLCLASHIGEEEIVELLIEMKADLNTTDYCGLTPVQHAVENNHFGIIKRLIKAGADVNWTDNVSCLTALHIAACKGLTHVLNLLVMAGVDVDYQDKNGISALHCAVGNGHVEFTKKLLDYSVNVNSVGWSNRRTPIFLAVDIDSLELINLLLTCGVDIEAEDIYGMTPVFSACVQGRGTITNRLLLVGSNVKIRDNKGNTLLHYASRNGNMEIVKKILQAGCNCNIMNMYYETALHRAVHMLNIEIIVELMRQGANGNLYGGLDQVTPLNTLINVTENPEIFELILVNLIKGDADLNHRAYRRRVLPLYLALDQNKENIAVVLLQHGADPNLECPHDLTILHKACQRKRFGIIDTLLASGLDWKRETWLDIDKYSCGINLELLEGYLESIPVCLNNNLDLFFQMQKCRFSPESLMKLTRFTIRKSLKNKLFHKINKLIEYRFIPAMLENFLMLKDCI